MAGIADRFVERHVKVVEGHVQRRAKRSTFRFIDAGKVADDIPMNEASLDQPPA
ncbi:hypothetical protein [uncultured Novosphingobium sp.]|uniref:hypothetical protein n=1 Tax=uncultured Novosphingobium sp. TaxID=292277 RepID=UPI003747CA63